MLTVWRSNVVISSDMATAERPKSRSRRRQSLFEPRDTGLSDGGHNSDSGSSTDDKLQQEILRLQDEIKVLSARREPVRRQSIRQALQSDDLSFENLRDSFELHCVSKKTSPTFLAITQESIDGFL